VKRRRGEVATLNDPDAVRRQYATETGLAARSSLYGETTGLFAGNVAFDAIAELRPRRFLEVGCGTGWFAARVQRELHAEVVAVDQSQRMVELARAEGVDARVADAQALPFEDGEFDCAAANWMLYHVPDLNQALAEIERVLRPRGRLVAITNGKDHLLELWQLVGAEQARLARHMAFSAENGADELAKHFGKVETRDAGGTVSIPDVDAIVRYLRSAETWAPFAELVPESVETPFVARRSNVVFVAEKA
jgi:SAM-dependent methyltransferase